MREMQRLADQAQFGGDHGAKQPGSSDMDAMRRLADEAEHTPDVHSIRAEMRGTAVREDPYAYDRSLPSYPGSYPQEDYLEDGGQAPVLITRAKKVRVIHGYLPLPRPMPLVR